MNNRKLSLLAGVIASFSAPHSVCAGDPAPAPKSPPAEAAVLPGPVTSGWRASFGPQGRQIGRVSFSSRSRATTSLLPTPPRAASSGASDGYARPDSANNAQTWNWGYESASQISGGRLALTTSSTDSYSRLRLLPADTTSASDLEGAGVFLQLESPTLFAVRGLTLSAAAGYQFAQDSAGHDAIAFRAERLTYQRSRTTTAYHDVSGLGALPAAPYSGTFSGPGPLIGLAPDRLSTRSHSRLLQRESFSSRLQQELDIGLHTFSLGPRLSFERGPVRLIAGLGAALHLATWDAFSRETLRSSRGDRLNTWTDARSGTEILPGLYAETSLECRLTQRTFLAATVRYDWAQDFRADLAPGSSAQASLGGWSVQAGVGFRF